LAGLGVSFKVPPGFERQPEAPGNEEAGWVKGDSSSETVTGLTFRALYDPEVDLSRPHRTFFGAWDDDKLAGFWRDTLAQMDGYKTHEASRHRGWPSAQTSLEVKRADENGKEINEAVEMRMVMHENVMLVMQCYDSSSKPVPEHAKTASGICAPFFDSLELEGGAPEDPPLPR
ncbi:MAG: hypothetical protein LBQ12_01040, partial [Deltaproteobacteria bacterium]|nr:hypothetical protein [Deltaproteobacteria bacterium]